MGKEEEVVACSKVSGVWRPLLGFLLRSVESFCTARNYSARCWAAQHNMLSKSIRKCGAVSVENNLHPYPPYSLTDSNSEAVCWGVMSQTFKYGFKYDFKYCPIIYDWKNINCGIWKLRTSTELKVCMSGKESLMSLGNAQGIWKNKTSFQARLSLLQKACWLFLTVHKNLTQF